MSSDPSRQQVPYQQLVQAVLTQIRRGELRPGDKLPSTQQLAAEHGVAAGTVQRALADLRSRGVVYSQTGRGSFVSSSDDKPTAALTLEGLARELIELRERVEQLEQAQRSGT
ncbi:GntR family transcriptional regulator [Kitasatospora sp. RB6PN24]|uniref:GntR family transcriptional regulator n=1 Tax=Kitasatospora humi TaxID=2893891 RepID=UPI001E567064|nr:GntR family transcriptional regulator [Kitasatospora humi]MCC9312356.1 GntR family transcriptional regulator [Kitasatospora humi]